MESHAGLKDWYLHNLTCPFFFNLSLTKYTRSGRSEECESTALILHVRSTSLPILLYGSFHLFVSFQIFIILFILLLAWQQILFIHHIKLKQFSYFKVKVIKVMCKRNGQALRYINLKSGSTIQATLLKSCFSLCQSLVT